MATEAPDDRHGIVPLRISHMFLAMDPRRFLPGPDFAERIERLVAMMKSSEPIQGHDEVLVAGEPEWRVEAQRRREGIPIARSLWDRLGAIAAEVGVQPPQPDIRPER
jgi:LDH2 family malate/lactate/ureidoglycolate dehydrogenase